MRAFLRTLFVFALMIASGFGGFLAATKYRSQAETLIAQIMDGGIATTSEPAVGPKILYYRNPMGLPDTSPVPKKDSMGMDYIAIY